MLTQRLDAFARFTRRDAARFVIASGILVVVLTAIMGADILPEESLSLAAGDLAPRDIIATKAVEFESAARTEAERVAARDSVDPQYDFTTENAAAIATEQQKAFEGRVARVDTTFAADLTDEQRASLLETAVPDLGDEGKATLGGLGPGRWAIVRTESARVLDSLLRTQLLDTEVAETRTRLAGLMAGGLNDAERALAAELISPLVVPNSSFDAELTEQERDRRAAAVMPVRVQILLGEVIVRAGERLGPEDIEKVDALGLGETRPDIATLFGWFLLSVLIVGMLLGWMWRFRPKLWHRDNALVLTGLLVVGATIALKVTAGRSILQFFLPTAAIGMLLAILLDASLATVVIALVAIIGGAVNGGSLEFTSYVFLGGMAGIVAIRRGDRLQVFVQAAVAVFVVNAAVVTIFSLLGVRDVRGVLELWFASAVSAAGSGVAAVGTFAVLGSVFGILTVFQLLELANPSQPLLRRLLVETPGTYHHSLMVGNLAERAAEAIGADPLVTRVAAYYHDVGKLANPLGFIENQAGGENIHDQLDPAVSAQILKQHVADGIDLAYKGRLPKAADRLYPAAPRDGDHELLLRPGEGTGGRAVRRADDRRRGQGRGGGRPADLPPRRSEAADPRGRADHAGGRRRGLGPIALLARRAGHPGDGQPHHRGAHRRRPVRRVRPHAARPGAHPRGVRRPAARHVPHADRVPAERGRRSRVPACRGVAEAATRPRDAVAVRRPVAGRRHDPRRCRQPDGRRVDWLERSRRPPMRPGAPRPASIGLILADDRELAELNATHLGQAGPTDVLSFPLLPPEAYPPHPGAADRSRHDAGSRSCSRPGGGHTSATSSCPWSGRSTRPPTGRGGQTGDVRWAPADELCLLVTHGTLHLAGWDHAEPAEEVAMRDLERRLLGR